jgi:FkbM family methyltransferase
LFVSPDSQLKYLKPGIDGFDPILLNCVAEWVRPGLKVWDIGANIGVFSIAAAALGADVMALEADSWLASLIRRSASLTENRGLSLAVVPAAASDRNGVATFLIAARGRASSTLESVGTRRIGDVRERLAVATLTLDTIMASFGQPGFVKIDVEGAEELVLKGALNLLSSARPVLLIEVEASLSQTISEMLKGYDYCVFDAETPPGDRAELPQCVFNTLAIPLERLPTH